MRLPCLPGEIPNPGLEGVYEGGALTSANRSQGAVPAGYVPRQVIT
jgi:hypothetical protein